MLSRTGPASDWSTATRQLTPREIVQELDRYIVGQHDAKRAVAVAMRNRWRRQRLPADMRRGSRPEEHHDDRSHRRRQNRNRPPARTLTGAPFIKVEATKYTEVGYYGRDVESMVRELVENAIGLVRERERDQVEAGGPAPGRRTAAGPPRPAARRLCERRR